MSSYMRVWVLQTCEDLENTEALTHLYTIVKGAIMLNETTLLEVLLNEENVMDVVGTQAPSPQPWLKLWIGWGLH
jgi:protein phosphatase-4 regulatory subunit 3